MRTLIYLLILGLTFAVFACEKKKTKKTSSTQAAAPPAPPPTVSVEFFITATKYDIKEPFDHPTGSSRYHVADNPFYALGNNSLCSTAGRKLSFKYSTTDTTSVGLWFFTAGSPTDTYKGTCALQITPSGSVILTYANGPDLMSAPYFATCKNAVVFY